MSVLIIGSEGSMGKRYQCILKHLSIDTVCVDAGHDGKFIMRAAERADGIIIATPTSTHFNYILGLHQFLKPILCEKPLSKNGQELKQLKELVEKENLNLTMTMQYRSLDRKTGIGPTEYNYFRHGNDGLYWDCLQPIGLARSTIRVAEDSPVWQCRLNGTKLNLSDMDQAYIDFVKDWLRSPGDNIERVLNYHYKVMELTGEKAN